MRSNVRSLSLVTLLLIALLLTVGTLGVAAQGAIVDGASQITGPAATPTPGSLLSASPQATQASEVYGIAVQGNYAYLGVHQRLDIVNISNPASPSYVGQIASLGGTIFDIAIVGNYAYVVTGNGEMKVVNVSNPASPTISATVTTRGSAEGIAISGNYAYVTDNVGLLIFNISNPTSPTLAGSYAYNGDSTTTSVALSGNYAYVADVLYSRLLIINVSNPASPTLAGEYSTNGWPGDVTVSGNYVHLMTWAPFQVAILNISNPASVYQVGSYSHNGAKGIQVIGNYSYVASGDAFQVVNVYNPYFPSVAGSYAPLDGTWDMAVSGNFAYTSEASGMSIINISNPASLNRVGFYAPAPVDPVDTIDPTVTWVAPVVAHESYDTHGEVVQLKASATDNKGVVKVRFDWWDNTGQQRVLIGEDTSSPYQINLNTNTLRPGCNIVNAGAFDEAGNFSEDYIWICLNPPAAPTLDSITNPEQDGTYAVSWSTVDGATGYSLEEQHNSGSWQTVSGLSGTGKEFTGKATGSWCYRVLASNNAGAGAWSATQCTSVAGEPSAESIYLSPASKITIGTTVYEDEDIITYDKASGTWSLFFDGSDVGLKSVDVNSFYMDGSGSILMSFDKPAKKLPGMGTVVADDSDIVRFTPTSLGVNTAGTFSLYFDGSDVALTTGGEDIDAIAFTPDGKLVISVLTSAVVPGPSGNLKAADEDLLIFTPTQLGNTTAGTWAMYFDGSDVNAKITDITAAWIEPDNGYILLALEKKAPLGSITVNTYDILRCIPGSLGDNTTCTALNLYWKGANNGFSSSLYKIDGFVFLPN